MTMQPTARLAGDSIQIDFFLASHGAAAGVAYEIRLKTDNGWQPIHDRPFPLRPLVLRTERAEPPTVQPAWAPGQEETNFALFHTDRLDGGPDVFNAGECREIKLDRVDQLDTATVRCTSAVGSLETTWQLTGDGRIAVSFAYMPNRDGWYSVGFGAFAGLPPEAVRAICAGPFLNERRFPVVPGVLPETHLPLPAALLETAIDGRPLTWALAADPVDAAWDWRDLSDARYAIGALNQAGELQPHIFVPVLGCAGSHLRAGETTWFRLQIQATTGDWWTAYRSLVRDLYGLRAYRENRYGSLTDAFHNMAGLLKDDHFGGWSERGKGLLNIEHRNGVKLASPGAALSAALVTGDRELLRTRALPTIEFSLSRSHYGFTWDIGSETVGQHHVRQAFEDLGGPAWDAPVLIALAQLARGYTPALGSLARESGEGVQDFYIRRSAFQVSLSLYHLTGEERHLDRAREQADAYLAERIETPATDLVEGQRFSIHIGSDWISLLDLYEATGEQRYLDGAAIGARWFVTLLWTRPTPPPDAETTTTSPERLAADVPYYWHDHRWATDTVTYPRGVADVTQETVPAWVVSPVGMTFEAWCTFRGRMVQNPGWAAHLLRLARFTGDELFRDLADNGITGRFTNYPGYYQKVPIVAHLKPDFPYLGPMALTLIYYHHILPQIGLTLDYLVEQARDRSGGAIDFPAVRDDSYVQFRHHLYGHAPGRFCGHDAWLWMPAGVVDPGSDLLNWIAAQAGDRFFIALSNTSAEPVSSVVRVDPARLGIDSNGEQPVDFHRADGTVARLSMRAGAIEVETPAHGLTALVIHGTRIDEPLHGYGSAGDTANALVTLVHDDERLGTVRAAAVAMGPEDAVAYVFSTATPEQVESAVLTYETPDGWHEEICPHFPFEFSVPIADPRGPFRFRFGVIDHDGQRHDSDTGELAFAIVLERSARA
ncbi:MAG: beta-L-arabinofuranosidase domain-containing protein [Thermomicrobiales bacterium]